LVGNHDFHYLKGVNEHYSSYQFGYAKNINRVEIESDRLTKTNEWMFLSYHSPHLKEIMNYAKKGILITYDYDDINEILKVILGKTCLDGCYVPKSKYWYIPKEDVHSLAVMYNKHYECLTGYYSNFQPIHDFGDSVLNVSWKELMYENVDTLVDKLSKFSEIAVSRFNINAINEWRRLTLFCIEDLEPLKQQILTIKNLPGMAYWRVKDD
jgi:hypothetical protein